ncbi:MAG: peptidylprolyl isomerase [Cytophagales bacterium]|nr:peptidylprolyl isomerase [Cytophagales bacterium]MDW8383357.1 peptidylprolyl isomerase [Flammeovirgaceae bacterium]
MTTHILKILISSLLGTCLFSIGATSEPIPKRKKTELVIISTKFGEITIFLFDETPLHKANFLKLVKSGFYDSIRFHRVIKDFIIQAGDPYTKPGADSTRIGIGGPGYTLPAEIIPHFRHERGTVAAARQMDAINPKRESSGSQFYIVQSEKGAPHLDGSYTIFGKVIRGIEIVDKIASVQVLSSGMPVEPIYITLKTKKISLKRLKSEYDVNL